MDVDRLLRLNARPMLQLADFVLNDPSAAEDAVEHSFVAAWRRRNRPKDETAFRRGFAGRCCGSASTGGGIPSFASLR